MLPKVYLTSPVRKFTNKRSLSPGDEYIHTYTHRTASTAAAFGVIKLSLNTEFSTVRGGRWAGVHATFVQRG